MKIASPTDDKIIIELTAEDMRSLDITYEEMNYSSAETRRVIWALLEKAGRELGRDIDPSRRMMIEAVPEISGGCMVLFTMLEKSGKSGFYIKTLGGREQSGIFEFASLTDLMDGARVMPRRLITAVHSSLYENSGRYRLMLCGDYDFSAVKRFLSEYGCTAVRGDVCCAHTREHWVTLAEGQAIERLAGQPQ